jgi:hypothetical protein
MNATMKHSSFYAATFTKDFIAAEQKVMVGAHIMCTLPSTEKAAATELTAITSELDLMIYNLAVEKQDPTTVSIVK